MTYTYEEAYAELEKSAQTEDLDGARRALDMFGDVDPDTLPGTDVTGLDQATKVLGAWDEAIGEAYAELDDASSWWRDGFTTGDAINEALETIRYTAREMTRDPEPEDFGDYSNVQAN